ncbi:MAG: hypothetical protein AAF809_15870, partial [Bacteroidota bacterium]
MTASTFAAALADRLLAGLPPDEPLTRALLAGLPTPVAHYLDRWLAQHVGRVETTLASPWVEETEDVAATRRALVAAMQHYAQVPVERREQVMRYAVGRIVSHLVRPGDALAKTIEETGEGPYTADTVVARLDWFTSHTALAEVVASYFDWKGTDALAADELRRLVRQIDQRLAQEESPSEWIGHLTPLFDLAEVLGERRVPAALVRAHLDARNLGTGALFGVEADRALSEAELLAMLQDDPLTVPPSIDIEDDDPGFRAALLDTIQTAAPPATEDGSAEAISGAEPDEAEALVSLGVSTHDDSEPHDGTEIHDGEANGAESYATATEVGTTAEADTAADTEAGLFSEEGTLTEELVSEEGDFDDDEAIPKESGPEEPGEEDAGAFTAVTPAPGIAPPSALVSLVESEEASGDDTSALDATPGAAPDASLDVEAPESYPASTDTALDRHLAPISDALDGLSPSDDADMTEPETAASADAAEPDGPPSTIEEATRDDQPLWTRYAAPPTPSVNDQFATPGEAATSNAQADDDVPLWRRFFTGGDSGPTMPEADADNPGEAFQDEPIPAETPSTEVEASEPAPDEPEPIAALEQRLLGTAADQRSWFVAQLTEGDEAAYDATLRALDAAGSWTEASQIIARDIFRRYRVNIYSAPAIAFTDAIETHFR